LKPAAPLTRALTALDAAIALIATLLVVQMWLLTATLEAYLAGHEGVAAPAVLVSALLFAACFGLYRSIVSIDRRTQRRAGPDARDAQR